ncbi:MAG TPA: TIGR03643 family protein [Cellvibrionaceae bacterium]|nr:TIGR03643 family protein [Cellvibrionaceae bacterium]
MKPKPTPQQLSEADESRIIEMAWEDRTPFEAIVSNYGLRETDVIAFMRARLKPQTFRVWRARVRTRVTKHQALRSSAVTRGYCPTQYKHRY